MNSAATRSVEDDPMVTLKALNARFIHNFITNDVPSHDAILHRDFVCMTARGTRENRDAYLKRWATGFDPEVVVYWDTRDEQITIISNVALVRSTNKHTIKRGGTETTGMTTYTDTYLFENGEWKCIQAQLTPVIPAAYPDDDTVVGVYLKGVLQG